MNNNKIWLIDKMGSDKSHAMAAWASTFLELDIDMPLDIEDRVDCIVDHILQNSKRLRGLDGLLNFLAKEGHNSPFRFSSFVFGMTTDIATHIQKLKHTVILEAENGESARYKELQEDKTYIPKDWRESNDPVLAKWVQKLEESSNSTNALYHQCLEEITPVLGKTRAKESSRFFKQYNSQINTVNKLSFDGVMQLYFKRSAPDAQYEFREIAQEMIKLIKNLEGKPFELSLKAFGL